MNRHLYLIGIGGVGMLWIADYALSRGWQLSGTDIAKNSQIDSLIRRGAKIHIGSDVSAIPADITEVIITSAITESAPHYAELLAVKARKIPVYKRAVWLGKLTKSHFTIAVSGTHGKTTTTAMIGWILDKAGLDPTVFTGSTVSAWNNQTRIGNSQYLVIEADEFDRSFHNFWARIAVVLNIDADHLDYYTGGLREIIASFRRFLRNLPSGIRAIGKQRGVVVAYGRSKSIRIATKGFKYGFRWYDESSLWPGIRLPQPGMVYQLNGTAAAKVAHELGIANEVIRDALATFPGTGRRMEDLGKYHDAVLIDDYAHHPEEIQVTLQALRSRYPKGEKTMALVFQPHQKARTKELLSEFGRCFDNNSPDSLILAPIYFVAGREDDIAISSTDIATEIAKKSQNQMKITVAESQDDLIQQFQALNGYDVIVIMGAGSIRSIIDGVRNA